MIYGDGVREQLKGLLAIALTANVIGPLHATPDIPVLGESGRELIPILDSAYAGFKESVEADFAPVRLFEECGIPFIVVCSFS